MSDQAFRYRDADERRRAIVDLVSGAGHLSNAELAEQLGVSEMTVRRDLRRLAEDEMITHLRGGARPPVATAPAESFGGRHLEAAEAKRAIAHRAAQLIQPTDVIAMDAGTSVAELAEVLPPDLRVSVITHSLPVMNSAAANSSISLTALGGDLHRSSLAMVGSATVDNAARLRARVFFAAAASADERGIYAARDTERIVKRTLMEISTEVVLLIDRRKFDMSAPVFLASSDEIDTVISDGPPPSFLSSSIKDSGLSWIDCSEDVSGGTEPLHHSTSARRYR